MRDFGHPAAVAASYRPSSQYLIGPEWYPAFSLVLRIVLSAYLGAQVVVFALTILFRSGADVGGALANLFGAAVQGGFIASGIVVAIFHLLQRSGEAPPLQSCAKWDPRSLPAVRVSDAIGRTETVVGIAAPAAFLVLLYLFRDAIGLPVEGGGPPLLNDVFRAGLPWLTALLLAGMALHVALFWQGRWSWPTRTANVALDLGGLALFWWLAAAVAAKRPELLAAGPTAQVAAVVVWTAWSVPAVAGLAVAIDLGKLLLPVLRRPRGE